MIGIGIGVPYTDDRRRLGAPPANFVGKVAGSVVDNPNKIGYTINRTALQNPSTFTEELDQNKINRIMNLDGQTNTTSFTTVDVISQQLYSFNLIERVKRVYGEGIFGNAVSTTDRVAWLKSNVSFIAANAWIRGTGPSGNKATLSIWAGSSWSGTDANTTASIAKVRRETLAISNVIDASGFFHAVTYADASNGTTASIVYTDYVELEVSLA